MGAIEQAVMAGDAAARRKAETVEALLRGPKPAQNAFEVTVERLGSAIRVGLLTSGEQLPAERELADIMGVSRTTVREAIRVLTVQGSLVVRRGRSGGTFVSSRPLPKSVRELHERARQRGTSLREILDYRLVVEAGIAEMAAERASPAQRRELLELAAQMRPAESDFPRYRSLDVQMHFLIAQASASPRLSAVLAEIHADLSDLMSLVPYSREACAHSTTQHLQIVRAIANGRAEAARRSMREHVLATNSFLRGLL
jgi:GntR family transcriptional regulator, transcriptional repressor for pyruvate dehydrogenase complex